ncbi:MAG: hypothetical protein GF308_05590 [Candidatus Heimdallarchaeota archaeon]|nr:hypothetical protein [Candidatus Heimdallarchaeota archaeon]
MTEKDSKGSIATKVRAKWRKWLNPKESTLAFYSTLLLLLLIPLLFFAFNSNIEAPKIQSKIMNDDFSLGTNLPKLTQTIENNTIWENQTLELSETVLVTNNGNLTIINSEISFTSTDISFLIENNSIIEIYHCSFESEGEGIVGTTSGSIVIDNTTFTNCDEDVIHLQGDYQLTIEHSLFEENAKDCVDIKDLSIPAVIYFTKFLNNNKDGINIDDCSAEIIGCEFTNQKDEGVQIEDDVFVTIEDCVFTSGTGDAIQAEEHEGEITIDNTTIRNGGNNGIDIDQSQSILSITNSLFENNEGDAIKTEGVSLYIDNSQFFNQGDEAIQYTGGAESATLIFSVKNSLFEENIGDAIDIRQHHGSGLIENVIIRNGKDDGMDIENGLLTLIIKNTTCTNNAESGIEIDSGTAVTINNSIITNNEYHGFRCIDIGQVKVTNCTLNNNLKAGFYGLNLESLQLQDVELSYNRINGAQLESVDSVEIIQNNIVNNSGFPEGSHGLSLKNIHSLSINDTNIGNNTGNGIILDSSIGLIVQNSISNNHLDGIHLINTSRATILNNTVSANLGHGIYFDNTTYGVVHYNIFTGNQQYGIFASNRTDGLVIDANYNYWGSDDGPALQLDPNKPREAISGPVNVTFILTTEGQVLIYTPPQPPISNETLFFIIPLIILVTIIIASLVVWLLLRNRWFEETRPHMAFIITRAGLPIAQHVLQDTSMESSEITLLSGFIQAIESFSSNLIRKIDQPEKQEDIVSLKEIQHSIFTILLRAVQDWIVVLVVSNSNPLVRRRMNQFSDEVLKLLRESQIDREEYQGLVFGETINEEQFAKLTEKYFSDLSSQSKIER